MTTLFRVFPFLFILLCISLVGSAPIPEPEISHTLNIVARSEGDVPSFTKRFSYDELADRAVVDETLSRRAEESRLARRESIGDKIKHAFQKVGEGIKNGFKKVGEGIKNVAQKVGNGIKTAAQKVGEGVKTAAKKVGEGVKTAVKKVGEGVKTAAKKVGEVAKKVGEGVKTAAKKVGEGVKTAVKKVGEGVKTAAKKVGEVAKKVGEGVKTAAKKVGEGVKTAAQKVGEFAKTTGGKIAKFGLQVYSTAQSVGSKVAKFIPGVGKPLSMAMDAASKVSGLAAEKIPVKLDGPLEKGFDVMNKIKNPIGGAAGAVIGALRRDIDKFEDLFERDFVEFDDDLWARSEEESKLIARFEERSPRGVIFRREYD